MEKCTARLLCEFGIFIFFLSFSEVSSIRNKSMNEANSIIQVMQNDSSLCPLPQFVRDDDVIKTCYNLKYPDKDMTPNHNNSNTFLCLIFYDAWHKSCILNTSSSQMPFNSTSFNSYIHNFFPDEKGNNATTFCDNIKHVTFLHKGLKSLLSHLDFNNPISCYSMCFDVTVKFNPLCAIVAWSKSIDENIAKLNTTGQTQQQSKEIKNIESNVPKTNLGHDETSDGNIKTLKPLSSSSMQKVPPTNEQQKSLIKSQHKPLEVASGDLSKIPEDLQKAVENPQEILGNIPKDPKKAGSEDSHNANVSSQKAPENPLDTPKSSDKAEAGDLNQAPVNLQKTPENSKHLPDSIKTAESVDLNKTPSNLQKVSENSENVPHDQKKTESGKTSISPGKPQKPPENSQSAPADSIKVSQDQSKPPKNSVKVSESTSINNIEDKTDANDETKPSIISENTQDHDNSANQDYWSHTDDVKSPLDQIDGPDQPPDTADQNQNIPEPSEQRDILPRFHTIQTDEESHFFTYSTIFILMFIAAYIGYHNKQKILAIVLEGRRSRSNRGRRRSSSANYRKLDCTVEEAVTSQCNPNVTQVTYY